MNSIAIDTSAIVEVLTRGPQARAMLRAIGGAEQVFVTSVGRVEAAFVLMGCFGWAAVDFERGWTSLGLTDVDVDGTLAGLAIGAFQSWGRGRSKAALNFGDCFSYALAAARDLPLLYVGDDFTQTDLRRVGED